MSRWTARPTGGATVAVVGRPNVGKSTLVNRLAGTKDAIVEEQPGVTRDRSTHRVDWTGHTFTIVDTGGWTPGWSPDRRRLDELVSAQAEAATRDADLVLFVVDATVGATDEDTAAASWLRKLGVPVLVVANKADALRSDELVAETAALHALGLGDVYPVSALHGRGSGDLLDMVLDRLRSAGAFDRAAQDGDDVPGVALIGRPNTGKSSLFNRLVGEERVIVDEVPGTTRDAIDTVVETADGRAYRFVDTAGLRRKTGKLAGADFYSEVRTRRALERAPVALLLVDASEPVAEWEQKLAREVLDAGRGLVLVLNKWDLVDADRREQLEREQDRLLHFVAFAPRLRVSALTGRSVGRLFPLVDEVLAAWQLRVPTARLNAWLADAVAANPPPLTPDHRPVRIRYATQVGVGPPRFKLFTNAPLQPAYLRYLERRLRESFTFTGTPLRLSYAVRAGWEERER